MKDRGVGLYCCTTLLDSSLGLWCGIVVWDCGVGLYCCTTLLDSSFGLWCGTVIWSVSLAAPLERNNDVGGYRAGVGVGVVGGEGMIRLDTGSCNWGGGGGC